MAETIDELSNQLAAHERIMQDRYEHLEKGMEEIKRAEGAEGVGMNLLGTTGLGLVGNGDGSTANGLILGALLGNGGLLGNRNRNDGEACVTPTDLTAALNGVTASTNTNAILQGIGDLKTAVPVAEGQVQLALQSAQADLNRNIDSTGDQIAAQVSAAQLANANNFAATSRQLSDIIATSLASQNTINTNVLTSAASTKEAVALYGNANLVATKDAATATALAVANSTKEILAALNDQNVANLQRQLTVAESTLAEDRARSRSREVEVNVTQSVTQNQNQLNFQQQQQQQFQILAQLGAAVGNLANDIQSVKQGSVVFNSGRMMDSGNQHAANTRVSG
jgi:hypothetical protein